MAYTVGLITSDGSLSKDKRHIDFTSKDKQLVELFRELTKPDATIGLKKSGKGLSYFRVQLGNVALYDFLLSVGLTPNKSLTMKKIAVPNEFFADFLRGLFDGDGSIYAVWDKRWKNSYMFYTTFCSGSFGFLLWLKEQLEQALPGLGGSLQYSNKLRGQVLRYAKQDSYELYDFMYYNNEVPHLVRKRERYLEIFASDPYA